MAELLEMQELVGTHLEEMLKERINAYVYVEFINGALSVTNIHNGSGWSCWFDRFDDHTISGYSLANVVSIILKRYKENVMREYFL